jgi:Citrate transporter.
MVGKKSYLVPIIIFFVSGILSAMGPGNIPIGSLMTVVAVTIAVGMKQNPILYALLAKLAANAFAITPLTPAGLIAKELGIAAEQIDFETGVMLNVMLWGLILGVVFCIMYRLDKMKPETYLKKEDLEKFTKNQIITLAGMATMVTMVAGFGIDVGLASFLIAAVLLILKVGEQKKSLATVPWGTLLLICGVGVLMNIVDAVGGIELLSNGLLAIMGKKTARPILAGTSGILSFFSSTTGVVMPTLIPTVPSMMNSFGFGFVELTSIIISSSFAAAFSPASTGGGLILAAYMSASGAGEEEQNKLFGQLLMIAVGCVVFNMLLSGVGVYGIIK